VITFLIILGVWLLPLWFFFRVYYFDRTLDGFDLFFALLMISITSWIGLLLMVHVTGSHRAARKAFFLPEKKDQSMQSKIFWYRVRSFFLALLLIKEK
jgi:hypothetical protein